VGIANLGLPRGVNSGALVEPMSTAKEILAQPPPSPPYQFMVWDTFQMKRTGGWTLGEEITIRCTVDLGKLISRSLGSLRKHTGAAIFEYPAPDVHVFSVSCQKSHESVRRAADIIRNAVPSLVEEMIRMRMGDEDATGFVTVDGVNFKAK